MRHVRMSFHFSNSTLPLSSRGLTLLDTSATDAHPAIFLLVFSLGAPIFLLLGLAIGCNRAVNSVLRRGTLLTAAFSFCCIPFAPWILLIRLGFAVLLPVVADSLSQRHRGTQHAVRSFFLILLPALDFSTLIPTAKHHRVLLSILFCSSPLWIPCWFVSAPVFLVWAAFLATHSAQVVENQEEHMP